MNRPHFVPRKESKVKGDHVGIQCAGDQANISIEALSDMKASFDPKDIKEFYYLRGYVEKSERMDPRWWEANTATRALAKPRTSPKKQKTEPQAASSSQGAT